MTIGEKIRAARVAKKMTQKQLGIIVGFSEKSAESRVQRWEYDMSSPTIEQLRPLATALGVSIDYLVP